MLSKKAVFINFAKFTEKNHLSRSFFIIKLQAWKLLSCEFCESFKNSYLDEHLRMALLECLIERIFYLSVVNNLKINTVSRENKLFVQNRSTISTIWASLLQNVSQWLFLNPLENFYRSKLKGPRMGRGYIKPHHSYLHQNVLACSESKETSQRLLESCLCKMLLLDSVTLAHFVNKCIHAKYIN